jgi:DHA3 family multidrug efflux protein-like MFS transporter
MQLVTDTPSTPSAPPPPSSMRTFYGLIFNTLAASISTIIAWFAVTFWAYLQTRSVIVTTVMGLMFVGGSVVTGVFFGALVDRYDKKRLMIITDAITLALFAAALLIYTTTPAESFTRLDSVALWAVIALVFAGIIIPNIRGIIQAALIPAMVPSENLDRANGIAGMITGTSFLIGSVFSGFLLGLSGLTLVLLLPIIVRMMTILHLWRLPIPRRVPDAPPAPASEIAAASDHAPASNGESGWRATYRLVRGVPGLFGMMLFACLNNFLSGVFIALMDPYGLSLMSAEAWGTLSGILGLGFLLGGAIIARRGLGKNPLRALFAANAVIWLTCALFTIQPSILLLAIGFFIFPVCTPFIEAVEHTIIQKVVPSDYYGRVFGFAQSIETAASPISTLLAGPLAQFFFIPFMTTGAGVALIGGWFGTGEARGMALLFTLAGIAGLIFTLLAMRSGAYRRLRARYLEAKNAAPVTVA